MRKVRGWLRHSLSLEEDTVIMVTELRCHEPGCPPLETVIAIVSEGSAPRQFKFHKSIAERVSWTLPA